MLENGKNNGLIPPTHCLRWFYLMKYLVGIICLTLGTILGGSAWASISGNGTSISPGTLPFISELGLEASFTQSQVSLRSKPTLRSSRKLVKEAIGKKAILLRQHGTWVQIQFQGQDHWVHYLALNRNLIPPVMRVLFKVSDINLRSGPGLNFPVVAILNDAKYKIAVPFDKSGNWVRIIFNKRPYWVHSSLTLQHNAVEKSSRSADQYTHRLSFFEKQKLKAIAGDSKAMKMVSAVYEQNASLHLELSYMWLSLAMEKAVSRDKKRMKKHIEEFIIPKLSDFDIANAEKRVTRCRKFVDCGETRMNILKKHQNGYNR